MKITNALPKDIDTLLDIYDTARQFMREHGNDVQWVNGYPKRELLLKNISDGKLYKVTDGDEIAAVFYFAVEADPTYAVIEGAWKNDSPYGVVHRVAVKSGKKGTGSAILEWALNKYPHIRVDTHKLNLPMQGLLNKNGFEYCGTIYVEDGTPRMAFEKII